MRWADQLDIITVAATAALAVGIAGFLASWLLRARSLRWHLAILAVVAVAAPWVGLIAITQQMFISAHDLTVATYVGSVAALVCTATVTPTPASARESSSRTST